jgi:hypothetical protein
MPPTHYPSLKEIGDACGVTKMQVRYALAKNNIPPAVRVGNITGYSPEVLDWLKAHLAGADGQKAQAPVDELPEICVL